MKNLQNHLATNQSGDGYGSSRHKGNNPEMEESPNKEAYDYLFWP